MVLGCGSTEPLRIAALTFSSAANPPVVAEPTYETVARAAEITSIAAVKLPLTPQGVHDVEKMVEAAKKTSAGLLYLCNPANPTGTIVTKDQLAWVVDNLPASTVLLCDEAYIDFVEDARYQSAVPHLKAGRRVVIIKTFSKIYGLAGMRLGYALGPAELIERMRGQMLGGMGINQAVVAGVFAGLEDRETYNRVKRENAFVRRYVVEGFRQMGYSCFESHTNFVMADLKRPVVPVAEKLIEKGFGVGRVFPSMPNHMRVTLGTMSDMQRFLPALRDILGAG